MRAYEYHHVVAFEETNLVGNVYYVELIRWQGRCRELFLRDHAPEILAALRDDLALVTLHCSCDYLGELTAFDAVTVRMRLIEAVQNRIELGFETWRTASISDSGGPAPAAHREELIARGRQVIACMARRGGELAAVPVPPALAAALEAYRGDG
jgi:enediyne biosynthesis thioesterase